MKNIKEVSNALNQKKEEIEEKIETESIESLTILLTLYTNMLESNRTTLLEFTPDEYYSHENNINRLRNILNKRSKESYTSNETVYSENVNLQPIEEEEDFFNFGKRRVNEYLNTAIDSLDSIRRQGRILENAQETVADGLRKMGFSERMVEKISSRYRGDYLIFVFFVILVIFLYFIIFKIIL